MTIFLNGREANTQILSKSQFLTNHGWFVSFKAHDKESLNKYFDIDKSVCDSVMMNKPSFLRDRTQRKRYETWRFLLLSPFGPLMRIDPGLLTPSCLTVVWCTTFCSLSFGGYSPASLSDITLPRIQCDVIAAWS